MIYTNKNELGRQCNQQTVKPEGEQKKEEMNVECI